MEDLVVDGRIIVKSILKKWDGVMCWIVLAEDRVMWRAFVNTVINFDCIKLGDFLTS